MSQEHLTIIKGHLREKWRRISLLGLGAIAFILVLIQVVYPWGSVPLYQTIDGVAVGGQSADAATKLLNDRYKKLPVQLYFGKSPKVYREPTTGQIGLTIDAKQQVESALYPWWLRLVPTSLWWAHAVIVPKSPHYTSDAAAVKTYMAKELGESCDVQAVNATLEYKDKRLKVVPAVDGGTCKPGDVERILGNVKPLLAHSTVRIPMVERPAKIHDDQAQEVAKKLTDQTKDGVKIRAAAQDATAAQDDVLGWLDFTTPDSGIVATVNAERSKEFFAKQLLPKVSIAAGTSRVTTLDFMEMSRVDGASGQTLDAEATIDSLNKWLSDAANQPVAKTKAVAPNIAYTRTYTPTDTGIAALITQYAQAHPGSFGVSFAELDGQRRHAGYQDTKSFRTASTYKLFVAYGALKRVESGAWHWSDQINGGRDLTKCLDDMIVKSDNPCGETMLDKIGYKTLTNELKAIGLTGSSFMNSFPETTASDLTMFVGALQSGQLLNSSSTATLLGAMKRNIYRQGVPAGASGQTANKVGFLEGFLHDAAIVYSPSGTYALTIMTDGSSWATIADLTRQIEKLRTQA